MIKKKKKKRLQKSGRRKGEIVDWREKSKKERKKIKRKVKWREKLTSIFLVCFFIYLTCEGTFWIGWDHM